MRSRSSAQEERAAAILDKHCAEKVHVHAFSTGDSETGDLKTEPAKHVVGSAQLTGIYERR